MEVDCWLSSDSAPSAHHPPVTLVSWSHAQKRAALTSEHALTYEVLAIQAVQVIQEVLVIQAVQVIQEVLAIQAVQVIQVVRVIQACCHLRLQTDPQMSLASTT